MARTGKFLRLVRPGRLAIYLIALWQTARHPQTPRLAKWLALGVLAYALSPIDLVPDFIPLLGQLDDLILIPLGVALVSRLIPPPLWQAQLQAAEQRAVKLPRLWWGAALVVAVWLALIALAAWALFF